MTTAFIELPIAGMRRALIEAASIMGTITSPKMDTWAPGTEDAPVMVIIRGGEGLPVVGQSAGMVLARAHQVRELVKNPEWQTHFGSPAVYTDFLDGPGGQDGEEVQERVG